MTVVLHATDIFRLSSAVILVAAAMPRVSASAQAAVAGTPATIVIASVDAAGDSAGARSFRRGVDLGVAEAVHAAALLRRSVSIVRTREGMPLREAMDSLRASGAGAVVAWADDARMLAELRAWSAAALVPVIVAGRADAAGCEPFVCGIILPIGVTARALLANASARDIVGQRPPDTARLQIALWHPALERFGASQLTDRYRARYGTDMDSDAWAGWMAVKIAWESALRASPGAVGRRDAIARGAFDGHKGRPLRFGADGVLQQPLVLIEKHDAADSIGTIVAEVQWPGTVDGSLAGTVPGRATACTRSAP